MLTYKQLLLPVVLVTWLIHTADAAGRVVQLITGEGHKPPQQLALELGIPAVHGLAD